MARREAMIAANDNEMLVDHMFNLYTINASETSLGGWHYLCTCYDTFQTWIVASMEEFPVKFEIFRRNRSTLECIDTSFNGVEAFESWVDEQDVALLS
jgi:hypothetical protein